MVGRARPGTYNIRMTELSHTNPKTAAEPLALPLTREQFLWGALLVFTLALRLGWLGWWPLTADEAGSALAAWRTLHGGSSGGAWSPLLVSLLRGLYGVFGASDAPTRLPSAIAGSSLVLLAALWRRELGRAASLAAGVLLALSPTLLLASQRGDGAILGIALVGWGITALVRGVHDEHITWQYIGAGLLGAALASAPNVITWLAAGVVMAGLWLGRHPKAERGALRSLGILAIGKLLVVALLAWLMSATALLTNLAGLHQAMALPWRWATGIARLQPPWGWYGMARNLLVYELLILVPAAYGAAAAWRRDRWVRPVAAWAGLALLFGWLSRSYDPLAALDALLPLTLLAALGLSRLWDTLLQHTRALDVALASPVIIFTTMGFFELIAYARVPDDKLLLGAGVGFILAILAWVGHWLWTERAGALRNSVWLILLLLVCWTLRADSALLYQTLDDPRESLGAGQVSRQVRALPEFLAAHSSHTLGDAYVIHTAYDAALEPLAGWLLRDFTPQLAKIAAAPSTADALVRPADDSGGGPAGYIGQRFVVWHRYTPRVLKFNEWLNWFLLREPIGEIEPTWLEVWVRVSEPPPAN